MHHSRRRIDNNQDLCCLEYSYIVSDTSLVPNPITTAPNPIPNPGGCVFLGGRNNIFEYCALLLYELVLLCLMLFIRFRRYKIVTGSLQKAFFKDTTRYMIYIMIMSTFSIVINLAPPSSWAGITDSPQIVMHSVLASRILFNLRESEGPQTHGTWEEITDIRFERGQHSTMRFEV
ncbi:hypothetical protein M405DRAFT_603470 [Rhizopogon salebrosus TDB-379]|nr:hypothetical protein M405DRAFT_603470 [Rhizopogon salebrosus TDB-379]